MVIAQVSFAVPARPRADHAVGTVSGGPPGCRLSNACSYPATGCCSFGSDPGQTGTRALIGAVFGPPAEGETGQARELLPLLDETMLLLIDRGFYGGNFLAAATAAGAPSCES
jgi:hypothetical protein